MNKCCLTSRVSDSWLGPLANVEGMVPLIWLCESKLWAPFLVPRASPARSGCFRWIMLWSCCFIPASTGDMPCMDQGEQVLSSCVLFLAVTATLLPSAPDLEVLRALKCSYGPSEMMGAISPDFLYSTGSRRALSAPRAQPKPVLYTFWKGSPQTG